MTEPTMALMDYLRKQELLESDFLRDAVQLLMQQLIELEVSEQVGAGYYERSAGRVTQRNGCRPRQWERRVGQIPLRKRSEKALLAVVQEAYVKGVSTRKVDDLVRALGLKGISKSKVSRICQELDELVTASLNEKPARKSP